MSHHGTVHQAAGGIIPHAAVQFSPVSPAKDAWELQAKHEPLISQA